ncbi:hypothetical protein BBK36DRAFT_1130070 [Trichoderma citrinoviride]|uniref:MACPF domain-containing protein n=1 Tax=Trichoderma citrinoviride TaxID=58853 RepID=A0A2T4AYL0_9HYPO|nr:hypothetical protein BBK36DRAFT_1130070 [Trichoderma citrinoviride]PTB62068.1 hypothetical protein BBK36DRAFT_1130070 [Trichoderma citrinoviride]
MPVSGIAKVSKLAPLTVDTLDPDVFNPLIPRVAQQAITRSPIRLPWQARVLPLGMFFRSAATANGANPFPMQSAFDTDSLVSVPIEFTTDDGSGSFRSSEVMSSSASTDHLSIGAGVGVDLLFLSASVSVQFDRDVMENRDSNKASVTTSYRAGTVAFVRPPELSADAFDVLRRKGIDGFHATYGDFYVGGYRIGGDASVLFSTDASSRSETETKRVKIDVESWFGDYHAESVTTSSRTERSIVVRVSAYSTIEQALISEAIQMGTPEFQAAFEKGRGIYQRAWGLDDSVTKVLEEIGVSKGELVTREQCAQLCGRAVVVELLLVPVECLRQVQYWTIAL